MKETLKVISLIFTIAAAAFVAIYAACLSLGAIGNWVGTLIPKTTTLTNQQIVEQSKYCTDNGLTAERFSTSLTGETTKIECWNKESKSL